MSRVMGRTLYPRVHRAIEGAGIVLWVMLTSVAVLRIGSAADDAAHLLPIVAGIALGLIGADFVAGLVHWLCDTWGRSDWPIVGPSVIHSFREHHQDPQAIVRHGFVETNGASSIGSLPMLTTAGALAGEGAVALLVDSTLTSLSAWLVVTNQLHKWAHTPTPPRLVTWLQSRGWILPPEQHAIHHRQPFDRHYCITTGWLNPLCERLDLFRRLERGITRMTGALPRRQDAPPRHLEAGAQ